MAIQQSHPHLGTMPFVWLVTGTSSGIGLETIRQLSTDPDNWVIATCRNPDAASAAELLTLKSDTVHIIKMDVGREQSIRESEAAVKEILGEQGIDIILNNAGVAYFDNAFDLEWDKLLEQMAVNVAGPAIVAQVFAPYLERGTRKVVVNYTSGISTIGVDRGATASSYSVSKAALNMLTYKQAKTRPDLTFIAFNPGLVRTNLARHTAAYYAKTLPPGAPLPPNLLAHGITVQESVPPSLSFFKTINSEHSGGHFDRNGKSLPW